MRSGLSAWCQNAHVFYSPRRDRRSTVTNSMAALDEHFGATINVDGADLEMTLLKETALATTQSALPLIYSPRSVRSIFSHADPLAVIEASLTSVKYAFYHTFGYLFLNALGYHHPTTTTFLRAIGGGFIGGAIFTVPYLILLLPGDARSSREYDGNNFGSSLRQLLLLGAEMLYSAVAGGVGMLILNGWNRGGVFMGVLRGLGGPFISYTFLYLALEIVLGVVWMVMYARTFLRLKS
ncbi:hypothetical protein D9615_009719 [Tricholomella constricta]|uniref:Uncharacterized protein n=1 Tax=Tricholomella constricta TaxID=117010 RepID=A0A8H5GT29_9AGAR|nr:hypothetical protein D9615_009719 [Tricholomella constricta]